MPKMFCPTIDNQCAGNVIVSKKGCTPILEFVYTILKADTNSREVIINDDFYNDLKNNHDNIVLEEYEYIKKVINFLYNKIDSSKSEYVLRAASILFSKQGIDIEVEDGIVFAETGDYVNFHDHSIRSICFRREIIQWVKL